jgi:hypothetical protein
VFTTVIAASLISILVNVFTVRAIFGRAKRVVTT